MQKSLCAGLALGLASLLPVNAEFLFTNSENFIVPTLDYDTSATRYSEWRVFYSRSTVGNLPDYYAEFGGVEFENEWYPTPRPLDNPSFPAEPAYYTSNQPNAFWDVSNPTITQTNAATGYITAGGNFYGVSGDQSFRLNDNTLATSDPVNKPGYIAETAVFQFQTDGMVVDLSQVRLVYTVSGMDYSLFANDLTRAEALTEYRLPASASTDPTAAEGYMNRVAIQWNLTGLNISSYQILWNAPAHTSFQQAALDSSDTYVAGIPTSRSWTGGSGAWSDGSKWLQPGLTPTTGSGPETNGNVRFENSTAAVVDLTSNHTLGALSFDSAENVTLTSSNNSTLTANTGISTTGDATGVYTIDLAYQLGALNLFSVNGGTVVMNGPVSGNYALVKEGEGNLVLASDNSFTEFLDVRGGEVRLEGANSYTGETTIRFGHVVVAADNALGSNGVVSLSVNPGLYDTGTEAGIFLEGQRTLSKNIRVNGSSFRKVIGARGTGAGEALYSGNLIFPSQSSDVRLRAENSDDVLRFTGTLSGTDRNTHITLDGEGTVVFSGTAKNFRAAMTLANGTMVLQTTIQDITGPGHFTIENGAKLQIDANGKLAGSPLAFPTPFTPLLIIETGGILSGDGEVSRDTVTEAGAILASENGSSLTLKSLDAAAGAIFAFELADAASANQVHLEILGNLTGSTSEDALVFDFSGDLAETGIFYDLINFRVAGVFDASWWYNRLALSPSSTFVLNTGLPNGGWNFVNNLDGSYTLQAQFTAVPEPSIVVLLGLGLGAFVLLRRKSAPLPT